MQKEKLFNQCMQEVLESQFLKNSQIKNDYNNNGNFI